MTIKRLHSIHDFPDYNEFAKDFDDEYPEWFTSPLSLIDSERCCRYCGNLIAVMRKHYCCANCNLYFKYAAHDTKVNSLRRFIHKYYRFTCQGEECGSKLAYEVPSGLLLPVYSGEVDHIIPLKDGGEHLVSNLQLLCIKCHMRKTSAQRRCVLEKLL